MPVLAGTTKQRDGCTCAFMAFAVAQDATTQGLFSHCLNDLFVYLFLPALGLWSCTRDSLVASDKGYSLVLCADFSQQWLILLHSTGSRAQASVLAELKLSSCGAWA